MYSDQPTMPSSVVTLRKELTRQPASQCRSSILTIFIAGSRPREKPDNQTAVPAKAGTHLPTSRAADQWIPAFAGTAVGRGFLTRPNTASARRSRRGWGRGKTCRPCALRDLWHHAPAFRRAQPSRRHAKTASRFDAPRAVALAKSPGRPYLIRT